MAENGALTSTYEERKVPCSYTPAVLRRKVRMDHIGRKIGKEWHEHSSEGTMKKVSE